MSHDPTAVMGRRSVAWVLDAVVYLGLLTALFASLSEYVDVPAQFESFGVCEQLQLMDADAASGCLHIGDRVYLTSRSDQVTLTFASLGYAAFFVLVQGVSGATPGKLLAGVRVVDSQGRRPGVGRSLVRTVLWAVDGAPWVVPLVGFIVGLTSTGHRRIGDMAASTYVVRTADRGQPVALPGTVAPPPSSAPWGAAPPMAPPTPSAWAPSAQEPTAPPVAPVPTISGVPDEQPAPPTVLADEPPTWEPPTIDDPAPGLEDTPPAGDDMALEDTAHQAADIAPPEMLPDPDWWSGPEATPDTAGSAVPEDPGVPAWAEDPLGSEPAAPAAPADIDPWEPPTTPAADIEPTTDASPTAGPAPFTAPGADPVADAPAPPEPSPLPPPQWDEARNTYIQWDPRIQQWLQWDEPAQQWRPIQG